MTASNSGRSTGLPGVILMLAANPRDTDKLRLEEEYKHILAKLGPRGLGDKIRHLPKARADELVDLLLEHEDVRIVHFSGHGTREGELLFEDTAGDSNFVNRDALAQAFAAFGHIKCVVLNACHSTGQARLIGKHVEWVVGMTDAVLDSAATTFAGHFYLALAMGKRVDEAFRIAQAGLGLSGDEQDGVPILYRRGVPHTDAAFDPGSDDDSPAPPAASKLLVDISGVSHRRSQNDEGYKFKIRNLSGAPIRVESVSYVWSVADGQAAASGPLRASGDVLAAGESTTGSFAVLYDKVKGAGERNGIAMPRAMTFSEYRIWLRVEVCVLGTEAVEVVSQRLRRIDDGPFSDKDHQLPEGC